MRRAWVLAALLLAGCAADNSVEGLGRDGASETPPTTVELTTTSLQPTTTTEAPTTTTALPTTVATTTPLPAPLPPTTLPPTAALPYNGWAIPEYIVACETGGTFSWTAYNPSSGASGPYQLMPIHFGGELAMNQSHAAQHAKAAELWAGGRGASHWAACL